MSKYQTIQKVAEDMGIDTSLIQTLIRNKELNKYRLKGHSRIFVDTDELSKLIVPVTAAKTSSVDLTQFEV